MAPKKKPAPKKRVIKLQPKAKDKPKAKPPVKSKAKPPQPSQPSQSVSNLNLSESSEDEEVNVTPPEVPAQVDTSQEASREESIAQQNNAESSNESSGNNQEVSQEEEENAENEVQQNNNDNEEPSSESGNEENEEASDSSSGSEIDERVIAAPRYNSTHVNSTVHGQAAVAVNQRKKYSWDKAGLNLSCRKINSYARKISQGYSIDKSAIVFMTGFMEYVLDELMDGMIESAYLRKKKRITPRDITIALSKDLDLHDSKCWPNIIIAGGGVAGCGIHPALNPNIGITARNNISAVTGTQKPTSKRKQTPSSKGSKKRPTASKSVTPKSSKKQPAKKGPQKPAAVSKQPAKATKKGSKRPAESDPNQPGPSGLQPPVAKRRLLTPNYSSSDDSD